MRDTASCDDSSANEGLLAIPKEPTRIWGLDEVLHGGLPRGRACVISGGPGSGKTIFGLEFLYRGAVAGEPGIFISFEEPAEAVRRNALALDWDVPALECEGKLLILDGRIDPAAIRSGEFDISGLLAILGGQAQAMGARNVVIDAIDGLLHLLDNPRLEREQLEILHRWLLERGLTTVMTMKTVGDGPFNSFYRFLDYMVDCIIELDQRVTGQISTRRLRVVKYRGSNYERNEFPFVITERGIRLVPVSRHAVWVTGDHHVIGTGLASLDEALGGGLLEPSAVVIAGASGTGKTSLAATMAAAAAERGDRVLYWQFEEPPEMMVKRLLSPGIDLQPAIDSGLLRIEAAMPETAGVEEHLLRILDAVDEHEARLLILDAISATRRISTQADAYDFLVRVTNMCRASGITCIMTYQASTDLSGLDIAGMGMASLVDTAIILGYDEHEENVYRTLLVLKSRGMPHSNHRYRFQITASGIELEPRGETQERKGANH